MVYNVSHAITSSGCRRLQGRPSSSQRQDLCGLFPRTVVQPVADDVVQPTTELLPVHRGGFVVADVLGLPSVTALPLARGSVDLVTASELYAFVAPAASPTMLCPFFQRNRSGPPSALLNASPFMVSSDRVHVYRTTILLYHRRYYCISL